MCVYIYIYLCVHMYISSCIYLYVCTYIYICMHTYKQTDRNDEYGPGQVLLLWVLGLSGQVIQKRLSGLGRRAPCALVACASASRHRIAPTTLLGPLDHRKPSMDISKQHPCTHRHFTHVPCICVFIYLHICIYIYTYMCIYIYMYICVRCKLLERDSDITRSAL